MNQWAKGHRPVPVERCFEIEKATQGEVRVWDLRPNDWYRVWPMLIGTDGAPPVPKEPEPAEQGA